MDEKRRLSRRHSGAGNLPTSMSRLARAISTKGIKANDLQAGSTPSLEMLLDDNLANLDPDKLINTFDSKLGLIQKLLKDYQNEGKQRPDGEKRQRKIAAQAASVAGEAKGKNKKFTEEEAYMNEKIERRVRSAGAGASRALSERVHIYRTNPVARAELHERCLMHIKVKAEADAKAAAEKARTLDFIQRNRTCLHGETVMLGQDLTTLPASGYSLLPRLSGVPLRPSTAPQLRLPMSTLSSKSLQGSSHRARPSTALSMLPTKTSFSEQDGIFQGSSSQRMHADNVELGDDLISEDHHAASAHCPGQRNDTCSKSPPFTRTAVTFQRILPPPSSPVPPPPLLALPKSMAASRLGQSPESMAHPATDFKRDAMPPHPTSQPEALLHPGLSNTPYLAQPAAGCTSEPLPSAHLGRATAHFCGHQQQSYSTLPYNSSNALLTSSTLAQRNSSRFAHIAFPCCDTKPETHSGHTQSKKMEQSGLDLCISTDAAKSQLVTATGGPSGCVASRAESVLFEEDTGGNRSVFGPHNKCWSVVDGVRPIDASPEAAAIERDMRLLLTSRPGGGGSPTKRREFNEQYKILMARRERQINEVRLRKEDLDQARMCRSAQEAKLKAEAEENERRIKEQAQRKMELIQRHRTWLGTCNLASKLWYLADCVKRDREVHPMRELRRRAAVTIAAWYKNLLQRRKWNQLVALQLKLRRVLAPFITAKLALVRQRCGERILHFCRLQQKGAAESAVIAVKHYRQRLITIQRAWRTSLAVRAMQQTLLYNHLSRFEKVITAKAQREAAVAEAAGRQHVKRSMTVWKAPSMSKRKTDGARRESSSGKKLRTAEAEDSVLEDALRKHLQPLPKDIKQQIVAEALRDCRKRFHYQMVAYMSNKAKYLAQKPIDDLRQALLKDSGLQALPELAKPQHPLMLVLLPKSQLKIILFQGIQADNARKACYEAERRARAEAVWMELQAARAKEGKTKIATK